VNDKDLRHAASPNLHKKKAHLEASARARKKKDFLFLWRLLGEISCPMPCVREIPYPQAVGAISRSGFRL
jgi:hypothetical protein